MPFIVTNFLMANGYLKEKKNMDPKYELRNISFEQFELREAEGEAPKLVGYASVFNQETVIWGIWREKVAPGAFKSTIQKDDIRALWNHNTDLVLGRNRAKTLSLAEDDHGLQIEITPPDTQAGRDSVTSIKRGDVSQMSIAFETVRQEWYYPEDDKELPLRTVTEAKLYEISPVIFPAFETTEISARSEMATLDENIAPLEEAMRLYFLAQWGMPLSNEQRKKIAVAVEIYQATIIPADLPGQEPEEGQHAETDAQVRLANMRRQLDLIEKS